VNELTRASLQQLILETRAALDTPIDVAALERRGVLRRAKRGWYTLLKPKALPPYAWQQATSIRSSTRRHRHGNRVQVSDGKLVNADAQAPAIRERDPSPSRTTRPRTLAGLIAWAFDPGSSVPPLCRAT
jgi:hypothetical protein